MSQKYEFDVEWHDLESDLDMLSDALVFSKRNIFDVGNSLMIF